MINAQPWMTGNTTMLCHIIAAIPGKLLRPLAYLSCHTLTCTYIPLPCVRLDRFYQTTFLFETLWT
jgi:hypothetical protein